MEGCSQVHLQDGCLRQSPLTLLHLSYLLPPRLSDLHPRPSYFRPRLCRLRNYYLPKSSTLTFVSGSSYPTLYICQTFPISLKLRGP